MLQSLISLYAAFSARFPLLAAWMRQTSTILGLAGIVGTVAGAVSGELSWAAAVPTTAAAVVALLMPGHPEAEASVRAAAERAVQLGDAQMRAAALAKVPGDLLALSRMMGTDPVAVAAAHARAASESAAGG